MSSKEVRDLIENGRQKLEDGKPDEAMILLDKALEMEPSNVESIFLKGNALFDLEMDEDALNCFDEVLKVDATRNDVLYAKSRVLLCLGHREESEKCIDKVLESEPESVAALNFKGSLLALTERSEEALKYFDRALAIDPEFFYSIRYKGMTLSYLGRDEEAIPFLKRALKKDKDTKDEKLLICLGCSSLNLGEIDEAMEYFDRCLEFNPENAYILSLKGCVLSDSGKKRMALGYFDDALNIDPNLFEALKYKGITLFWLNKEKEAINLLNKALSLEPTDEDVLIYLGWSLICLNKYNEGMKFYDKVLSLNTQNTEAMYRKAEVLVDLDKKNEAMNYLDGALKIEPEYTDALMLKAGIYRTMEKPEKALDFYEKAAKVDPTYPDPWTGIGNVFKDMEKKKEAIEAYEKFVDIIRKNKLSDRNLDALRVKEYLNWVKSGEPITFSPEKKPQYWQWSTKSEYYLNEDGTERTELEPQTSHDPGAYWTCHKDTLAGDLILLYRAGTHNGIEYKDIKYLIMARSDAYPLDDIEIAVKNKWDYGCDYIPLFKFKKSLKLSEMREDPYLEGWNAVGALFHMKAYSTKEKYWNYLVDVLMKKNPDFVEFWNTFNREDVIAQLKTEKELEDELEKKIYVLNNFGHDLEVIDRQKICRGDDGRIDLLCKDNNSDDYVVIELKIDRANRNVFGQISGYMGWVMDHKANGGAVKGIVISRGYDKKFQSALKTNPNIDHIELVDVVSELGMKLK